jgi:hypothetical protein
VEFNHKDTKEHEGFPLRGKKKSNRKDEKTVRKKHKIFRLLVFPANKKAKLFPFVPLCLRGE